MDASKFKIGTKLEIEIPEINNNASSSNYSSQLIDIIDEKTISISAPMYEGRFKYLTIGLDLYVYFLNDNQDLLSFKAIVKGHRKNGPIEAFDITIHSEVKKIQRRRFYRLDEAVSCKYTIISEQLISIDNLDFSAANADLINAFTKNVSGSGCCLVLDKPLDAGTVLDITFDLQAATSIRVLAQVIRSIPHNKKFEVGLNFLKIAPRDLDILTKFIFEKQRLILKNTLRARIK
jgi:c-di-GMP-binding flagellar brake protein YcgR